MTAAAAKDGVRLQIVSAFRSVAYQHALLNTKLKRMSIDAALRINAAPGYSEHHAGCAVDMTTPGAKSADVSFAGTRADQWLMQRPITDFICPTRRTIRTASNTNIPRPITGNGRSFTRNR